MDLRDLTYFETIARTGHLGKAAELLHKSQPALSKSIQRLEEALGAQLFRREGRRIRLTEVGELLLQRGRQLQLSIAETEREVRDFASGQIGTIRLGCSASMAEHLLPQLASFLLERAPELRLKLSIGQDDILREFLSSGRLDAIICPLNAGDPHLLTFPILQDEAVVVASADHSVFSSAISIAALCQYRWVLPGDAVASRRWIDEAFRSHQLPAPTVQIEANAVSLLPRLIAKTQLLSFLARETLVSGRWQSTLREVPIPETTMTRTVAVSVRAEAYLAPAVRLMVELLKADGKRFFSEI